jgi:heat shock protein HslJ
MKSMTLIASMIVLGGCARLSIGPGAGGSPGATDVIGAWVLVDGSGPSGEIEVPDGWRITLVFDEDRLHGQACNNYGGGYTLDGNRISFTPLYMTEMACEDPMMSAESAYHAALAAVTEVERSADSLVLRGAGAELNFGVLPPVPDSALLGTRWNLDSLINADAVSSVQGEAWLELGPDGTLRGSTGCRDLAGRYVVDGDRVVATDLRADGACPQALAAQDAQVVGVIGGGASVAVEGNRLTMTGARGAGLGFVAPGDD